MVKRGEQEQLITEASGAVGSSAGGKAEKAPPGSRRTHGEATVHGEDEPARMDDGVVSPGDVLVDAPQPEDEHAKTLSKETLLPVSGMVRLSPRELEVIDHPAFQRLFEIYQLGQTNLVYRGATHMRGEHAIGTLHATTLLADATKRNAARGKPEPSEHWQRGEELSEEEVVFVRLGALLHDIGHLPAGHTLEDELGLLVHHDGDERINMVFDRTDWHGRTYKPLRAVVDEKYAAEAQRAAQRDGSGNELTASKLLIPLISSDHKGVETTPGTAFRMGVCRDLIGNTICADLVDYLHRDWLHLGKPRAFDPRLLDYLEILTRDRGPLGREDRLAINLRGAPRPRPDAVTAILDLLESRYQLAEIALFHRVKLAASGMLERAIAEYRDTFPDAEQVDALALLTPQLLECSDLEMLKLFESKLLERRSTGVPARVDGAVDLIRRLRVRELHRDLHILYEDDAGGPEAAKAITDRFCGDPSLDDEKTLADVRRAANDRLSALRTLEQDFALNSGDIVMYCPPLQMNTKIAEVGIYFNGIVDSLASLDAHNRNISGGHLRAQQERFHRLWRVSFAIDDAAYRRLEDADILDCLRKTIEQAVLWRPTWEEQPAEDAVRRIAEDMTKLDSSPWRGCPIVEPALNREQSSFQYPGGAPSIRSFIGEKLKVAKTSRRS
jgi:HD superfamily phosphohydrolase